MLKSQLCVDRCGEERKGEENPPSAVMTDAGLETHTNWTWQQSCLWHWADAQGAALGKNWAPDHPETLHSRQNEYGDKQPGNKSKKKILPICIAAFLDRNIIRLPSGTCWRWNKKTPSLWTSPCWQTLGGKAWASNSLTHHPALSCAAPSVWDYFHELMCRILTSVSWSIVHGSS